MDAYITEWGKRLSEGGSKVRKTPLLYTPPVKSLEAQLADYLNGLPEAMRNRIWTTSELLSHLRSPKGGRASAQQLSALLKQKRWRKVRLYGNGWEGNRAWLLPCFSPSASPVAFYP